MQGGACGGVTVEHFVEQFAGIVVVRENWRLLITINTGDLILWEWR